MATKLSNFHFQWTDLHLSREETDRLRQQHDVLASAAVIKLNEIAQKEKAAGKVDLLATLEKHHNEDATLSDLWNQVNTVPEWVDWDQLARGQKFFYRYAAANIIGFALQSFLGENSAASGVVEVLVRTGGFSTRTLLRRLLGNFQMLLAVTDSLKGIKPGGNGHSVALRVRLLHASVHNRITKLTEADPSYFDTAKFGVPVNSLDALHSLTVFSCNHAWLHLPQQGITPGAQERRDYIALWRYVGYIMGAPHEYLATEDRAKAVMETMLMHERVVTPTSFVVAHNFVQCLKDWPPFNISDQFIQAGGRALNGDETCDILDVGRPGLYSRACWKGHCWLVRSLALMQQTFPTVDEAVTNWFRRTLHWAVVEKGLSGGSDYRFTHVPTAGRRTGKEDNTREPLSLYSLKRRVEIFYFCVFLMGSGAMAGLAAILLFVMWRLPSFVSLS